MLFDTHMHTEYSTDSKMKLTDAIAKAKEFNKGIIITEHLDPIYPKEDEFRCDIQSYINDYSKYRDNNVLLGIEIGLSDIMVEYDETIGNDHNLDYIIGSIHSVNNDDIYLDYPKLSLPKYEYFKKYFEYMKKVISLHNNFDSLGHIDYICRYSPFEDNNMDVVMFKKELSEIFELLISKNKVLELNTVRLLKDDTRKNVYDIFSLYKEVGGKYLTIGSDAHNSNDVFRNWDLAIQLCTDLKLTPVYFKNRKMIV